MRLFKLPASMHCSEDYQVVDGKTFNQKRLRSVPANYISSACSWVPWMLWMVLYSLGAAVAPTECLIIFNYFERRIVPTLALTTCRIPHTLAATEGNRKCYCRCASHSISISPSTGKSFGIKQKSDLHGEETILPMGVGGRIIYPCVGGQQRTSHVEQLSEAAGAVVVRVQKLDTMQQFPY